MNRVLFWLWLVTAALITGGALLIDVTVQQNYRQGANDPQIQMAADLAEGLKSSVSHCQVQPVTNITTTLAPFVDVFNADGMSVNLCLPSVQNVAAIGQINNHLPKLPSGVFRFARANSVNRFTWQPQPDQRFAAVLRYYHGENSGYVLAARSLREVELRVRALNQTVLFAWLTGFTLATAGFILAAWHYKKLA